MLIAIWARWRMERRWWWIALIVGVLAADVLIGSWLVAWEIKAFKEMMER